MNNSLEFLLAKISKYLPESNLEIPILISAGNKFHGWSGGRVHYKCQLIFNAYTAPANTYGDFVDYRKKEILSELSEKVVVLDILFFPYEDVNEMRIRLEELIAHYGGDFAADSLIDHYTPKERYDRRGYLFITVINIPFFI